MGVTEEDVLIMYQDKIHREYFQTLDWEVVQCIIFAYYEREEYAIHYIKIIGISESDCMIMSGNVKEAMRRYQDDCEESALGNCSCDC